MNLINSNLNSSLDRTLTTMSDKHEDGQLPRPPALPVAPRLASIIMSRDGQSEQALVVSPREAQVVAVTHPLMVVQPVNTGSSPYHGTPSPIEPPSITFLQSQSLWTHSVTSGEEIRQAVWGHFSLHDKVEMYVTIEFRLPSPKWTTFSTLFSPVTHLTNLTNQTIN